MVKPCLLILSFLLSLSLCGQDDIRFVADKIRSNYFPLGGTADTGNFQTRLLKIEAKPNSFEAISSLVVSFNDPHLIFIQHNINNAADSALVLNRRKTTEIHSSLSSLSGSNPVTGYWMNDRSNCIVAITPIAGDSHNFEGYAVECKAKFYTGTRVLRSWTGSEGDSLINFIDLQNNYRQAARLRFISADEFQVGNYSRWKRIKKPSDKMLDAPDQRASVKIIDSSVLLFTIPENSYQNIAIVDSLVKEYDQMLRKTTLLIIDIRNNPGGSSRVPLKLLPYVYTDSIVKGEGYTYISEDLINYESRILKTIDSLKDSLSYRKQLRYIDSLKLDRGKMRFMKGKTIIQDTVYKYPKQVAILANYACMSASEVMLLYMRQSRKVNIFGERTAGATDNLDYFPILSPTRNFVLYMPSFRIRPTKVYGHYGKTGIAPDITIPKEEKDWVNFVIKYFEKI